VEEAESWLERFDVDEVLRRVKRGTPKGASLYPLDKAKQLASLTLEEAALLLLGPDPETWNGRRDSSIFPIRSR
jgi:hypothetical protein